MSTGAMLDLVLTSKEGLVGNVKLKGSLGCSHHEMVDFKILRAARRAHSKLTTQRFGSEDVGLLRDLLSRVPWDKALVRRGAQERWFYIQGSPPPSTGVMHPNKEKVREKCQEACMDEQVAPGQTPAQKESLQRREARTGGLGGIQRNCPSSQGSG